MQQSDCWVFDGNVQECGRMSWGQKVYQGVDQAWNTASAEMMQDYPVRLQRTVTKGHRTRVRLCCAPVHLKSDVADSVN